MVVELHDSRADTAHRMWRQLSLQLCEQHPHSDDRLCANARLLSRLSPRRRQRGEGRAQIRIDIANKSIKTRTRVSALCRFGEAWAALVAEYLLTDSRSYPCNTRYYRVVSGTTG